MIEAVAYMFAHYDARSASGHTRSYYVNSIAASGCSVTTLVEGPVGDASIGTMIESSRQKFRNRKYCLIVVARKT